MAKGTVSTDNCLYAVFDGSSAFAILNEQLPGPLSSTILPVAGFFWRRW